MELPPLVLQSLLSKEEDKCDNRSSQEKYDAEDEETLPIAQPVFDRCLESTTVDAIILDDSPHAFHELFKEQKSLFEDHKHFFEQKIADPKWAFIISSLTPFQFSLIISNVSYH